MLQNRVCSHNDFLRRWRSSCDAGGVPTLWGYALQNHSLCAGHDDEVDGPFDDDINTLLPAFIGGGCESLILATAAPVGKGAATPMPTISEFVADNDAHFRRTVPRRLDTLCTWYREHFQVPLLPRDKVLYVLTVLCDDDALMLDLVRAGASGTTSQLYLGNPSVNTRAADGVADTAVAEHVIKGPITAHAGDITCDSAVVRQGGVCIVTLNIVHGAGWASIGTFLVEAHAWAQSAAGVPVLIIASLPAWLVQDDVAYIKAMLKAPNRNRDCCSRFFEWLNNVRRCPLEMQNHNSGHVMQTTDADTMVVIGTEGTMEAVSVDTVYTESGGMRRHMLVDVGESSDGMQTPPAGRRE